MPIPHPRPTKLLLAAALLAAAGCERSEPAVDVPVQEPFIARGNEPGWMLAITDSAIALTADYGEIEKRLAPVEPTATDDGRRYDVPDGPGTVTVTIVERICEDDATGMPHPSRVTVTFDGRTLTGCGGEPASLIENGEWVAEDIDGRGILDRSHITLEFEHGRVRGRVTCNEYAADYQLTGEGLHIGVPEVTEEACPDAMMAEEARFLEILASVERFSIDETGALVLHATDGRTLLARR